MLERLFPKKTFFYDLLEQHARLVLHAAQQFSLCLQQGIEPDSLSSIKAMEHEADQLVRKGIEAIHKVFITPLDRDLIHDLLIKLDDVIDNIDAATDLLLIYKIHQADPFLCDLAALLEKAAAQVLRGVQGLPDLRHSAPITHAVEEINRIEHQADSLLYKAMGKLFEENKDAIEIIKYKELYENLEEGTDRCNDVADLLVSILLENA